MTALRYVGRISRQKAILDTNLALFTTVERDHITGSTALVLTTLHLYLLFSLSHFPLS